MLFGLIIVAIGVVLLASQLINVSFWPLFKTYWPIALIIYGFLRLFKKNKSKAFSLILIGIGVVVQLNTLGYLKGNSFSIFLALILIILGLKVMISAAAPKNKNIHRLDSESAGAFSYTEGRKYKPDSSYEHKDMLDERFVFTSDRRTYQSNTFSGGSIEAVFSNVNLDLKNVLPLEKEILLDCRINFSSVTVDVPSDWHVIVNGKHYYSKNEIEFDQIATATLIVDSQVFAGSLRIV